MRKKKKKKKKFSFIFIDNLSYFVFLYSYLNILFFFVFLPNHEQWKHHVQTPPSSTKRARGFKEKEIRESTKQIDRVGLPLNLGELKYIPSPLRIYDLIFISR